MQHSEERFEIEALLNELTSEESLEAQKDTSIGELEPIEDGSLEFEIQRQLYIPKCTLTAGQIVNLLRRMLREINPVYIDLAEKTAFCAIKVYDYAILKNRMNLNIDRDALILLSVLFTVGCYKDEFNMKGPDGKPMGQIKDMFLYSYLYLKHLTPLKDISEAILFYNYEWKKAKELKSPYVEYASLIFTCMRICIQLRKNHYVYTKRLFPQEFMDKCRQFYDPIFLDIFFEPELCETITKDLRSNNSFYLLDEYCNALTLDYEETFALLKMMIYSVDFVSTSTVTHIISTAFHAVEIAKLEKLSESDVDEVFTGALLHDLGKMAIDVNILESSGRLTDEQMEIMRGHVKKGDEMYRGIVGNKLADIASRHHENLDGSGYPYGIKGDELTPQQRILSIADVFSALTDARTYKPSFPKEKTLSIMADMAENHKFDPLILNHVSKSYDTIKNHTEIRRPMLSVNLGNVILDYMRLQEIQSIPELFGEIHREE